jgi:hypothetical protein
MASQAGAVAYNDSLVSPALDAFDCQDAIDAVKSTYLPLSGGDISGPVVFTGLLAGIDATAELKLGTVTATAINIGQSGVDTTFNGRIVANQQIYSASNNIVLETGTLYTDNIDAVSSGGTLNLGMTNAEHIVLGPGGGVNVRIADSNTDSLGFYGNAGIIQRTAATADATAFSPGAGVPLDTDGTFTVSGGSNAYTVGQILQCLVSLGLLAA